MEYVQTHVFIMEVVQTHVFIMEDVQTHVFLPKAVSYFEALSKKTVTFPISIFILSQLKYIYILYPHFYDYRCQSNNSINEKKSFEWGRKHLIVRGIKLKTLSATALNYRLTV